MTLHKKNVDPNLNFVIRENIRNITGVPLVQFLQVAVANRPGFKKHKKLWTLKQGLNSDVMFN